MALLKYCGENEKWENVSMIFAYSRHIYCKNIIQRLNALCTCPENVGMSKKSVIARSQSGSVSFIQQ